MACDHLRHRCDKGKWTCAACGQPIPTVERDWTDGRAPTSFLRGGRARLEAKFFTPSQGDIKPHFNESLGCHVTSRTDMLEKAKRRGLRPVTPDDIGTPGDSELAAKKDKERVHEAVMNPKRKLKDAYYDAFNRAPVSENIA